MSIVSAEFKKLSCSSCCRTTGQNFWKRRKKTRSKSCSASDRDLLCAGSRLFADSGSQRQAITTMKGRERNEEWGKMWHRKRGNEEESKCTYLQMLGPAVVDRQKWQSLHCNILSAVVQVFELKYDKIQQCIEHRREIWRQTSFELAILASI